MEDLKKYKGLPDMLQKNERLLKKYPKVLNDAAFELLNVNGVSKKDKEKLIWKNMKQEIGLGNMVKDMLKIWRNVI